MDGWIPATPAFAGAGKRRYDKYFMSSDAQLSADEVIRLLGLEPHPEGGYYRETFRDPATVVAGDAGRAASTAIYFLLRSGEVSRWHRVDAAEVWHWYAGDSLTLSVADAAGRREFRLGSDLAAGEARRRWCRPAPGSRPGAWAPGHWSAAR